MIFCRSTMSLSRRQALVRFWSFVAASPLLRAEEGIVPLEALINAPEFEQAARRKLPAAVFDRIRGGVGDERTLRRNRERFQRITFRPRVLVDVSKLDLSVELFGRRMFAPILAGPTARHARVDPQAEAATAAGAGEARAEMVVSERADLPLEKIAAAAREPLWLQLSPRSDEGVLRDAAERAAAAGCRALCLTVGGGANRVSDRDVRNRAVASWPPDPAAEVSRLMSGERALRALKKISRLPVAVKGVLSPEQALSAIESGADAVVVSNHGGRVLDGAPATIEALPKIADAVAGRVPILIDGGFRRGSDVVKALALGATAVLLGRPILWGLAAYGAAGVRRVLELLQSETALTMALSGRPRISSIDRKMVRIHRR